jgi:hypothetical protein
VDLPAQYTFLTFLGVILTSAGPPPDPHPLTPCLFLQGRGEVSVYHDLPGLATTTLAADVQTSGAAVAGESLPVNYHAP